MKIETNKIFLKLRNLHVEFFFFFENVKKVKIATMVRISINTTTGAGIFSE